MLTDPSRPVAIITGAGKGIGRATALELHARGYDLILTARTAADLDETLRLTDGNGLTLPGDVTNPAHATALVDLALARFGRLDALVNNAGYAPVLSMEQTTPDQWRQIIDTNLSAAVYLCRAAWPALKRQGGAIVNLSSAAARDPFPGLGLYGAAKAALNLLGLALAREGEPLGIRVHTIAPSATETDMFRTIMTPDQVPTERIMQPADVAQVIADCLTPRLAYTSGEVIYLHKVG